MEMPAVSKRRVFYVRTHFTCVELSGSGHTNPNLWKGLIDNHEPDSVKTIKETIDAGKRGD